MAEVSVLCAYEAEQAVLGGLMLENERWDEVVLMLSPDDFYVAQHRAIFRAMSELAVNGQPLDLITLSEHLEHQGRLDVLGGFAYLAELSKNTPSAANIMAYAGIVVEKSVLRQLQATGNTLIADVAAPNATSRDVLDAAERRLFALAQNRTFRECTEASFSSALDTVLQQLESVLGSGGVTGTPTGFDCLDEMTCGLQPGDLVLLAARPSMGKTSLALSMCLSAARRRTEESVLVFSIEMPKEQLILRMLSMLGRVELNHLRSGNMDDEDWARVSSAVGMALGDGGMGTLGERLIIDDCSQQTPSSLRASARRYTRLYGKPALIMVDYLQ
ncbi:replicative DNA helicase, partial [Escherichia coli]